jgi:hypothetical protein
MIVVRIDAKSKQGVKRNAECGMTSLGIRTRSQVPLAQVHNLAYYY